MLRPFLELDYQFFFFLSQCSKLLKTDVLCDGKSVMGFIWNNNHHQLTSQFRLKSGRGNHFTYFYLSLTPPPPNTLYTQISILSLIFSNLSGQFEILKFIFNTIINFHASCRGLCRKPFGVRFQNLLEVNICIIFIFFYFLAKMSKQKG